MDEKNKIRARAYFFLGRRAYGSKELSELLVRKGFGAFDVKEVINEFVSAHLIDDEAVIEQWLELVAERKGFGYGKIVQKLRDRKFENEQIHMIYERSYKNKEFDIALRESRKKMSQHKTDDTPVEKIKESVGRFLYSRGFGEQIIYQVFDQLFK